MLAVEILDAMKAAGASAEVLLAAIRAAQEIEDKKTAERRARDTERKRKSRASQNVTVTSRDGRGQPVTPCDISDPPCSNTPPVKEDTSSPPRGGSEGASAPVYADSVHELWGEGVPILIDLGMTDRNARGFIGRCLKSTKNDAQLVLGAIQRARDHRVIQPESWITRALSKPNGNGHAQEDRTVVGGIDRVLAKLREFDQPGGGGEPSQGDVRLLSKGRRE